MEGGWSQGEKVKALCGKGQETKVVLSLWEGMGGERGKSIHLTDRALPLAPGTFLSTESWEGWRSRKGVLGALGEVGIQPQRRAAANQTQGCPLLAAWGIAEPGTVADLPGLLTLPGGPDSV